MQATQAEMEALIERTAMSAFIREKKDFFVALFDADGDLIVGADRPTSGDPVRPVFAHYPRQTMRPGDIYWYNDCYGSAGALSHSPDQVFIAPVYVADSLLGFAQSWAHFSDIGGMRPGSISPDSDDQAPGPINCLLNPAVPRAMLAINLAAPELPSMPETRARARPRKP